MTSLNPAIQLAIFTANARDMASFLSAAMDALSNSKHELTDAEKSGFSLCVSALKQNIGFAHEADLEIWDMEGGHA